MSDPVDLDRLKGAFDQAVQAALPQIVYAGKWECKVISQNADGTLDLEPNDARIPTQKNIPIWFEMPGVQITVQASAQVLLGWRDEDPSKPYAALWPTGASGDLQSMILTLAGALTLAASGQVKVGAGANLAAARKTDAVSATGDMASFIAAVIAALAQPTYAPTTIPAPPTFGTITGGSSQVEIA